MDTRETMEFRKEIFGSDENKSSDELTKICDRVNSDASIDTFTASIQGRWVMENAPGSRPYRETLSEFSGDIIFFDRSFTASGDATYRSNVMPRWVDSWGLDYDDTTETLRIFSRDAEFRIERALNSPKLSFRSDVARSGFQLTIREKIQIVTGRNWYLNRGSYISMFLR